MKLFFHLGIICHFFMPGWNLGRLFLFQYFIYSSHKISGVEKLNNFILENDFDEVITHCAFGLSRSPAIMICIAKILENKFFEDVVKEYFKAYNRYIVKKFEEYSYKVKNIEITRLLNRIRKFNNSIFL